MIAWTTPTIPILVKGGNVLAPNARIEITFSQGDKSVTVQPDSATAQTSGVLCEVSLSQLQTGGFCAGIVNVQANVIDNNDYRAASSYADVLIGSNLLPKVVNYDD